MTQEILRRLKMTSAAAHIENVDSAIECLKRLDFDLPAIVRIFGRTVIDAETEILFTRHLMLSDDPDDSIRCVVIIDIYKRLIAIFSETKIAEMQRWLTVEHQQYQRQSVKSLMLSGDVAQMRLALEILERAAK